MAFRDLEEGVSDLFSEANGFQVTRLDQSEAKLMAWRRRRNCERYRALWLRWRFELKVRRARARTWTIPLLPREVSCVRCRLDFCSARALHAHWYEKHIKRNQ